jgi:hypothetical protein
VNSGWFHFGELNGAGAPGSSPITTDGLVITNLTYSFGGNYIQADQIHQILESGIQSGTTSTTEIVGNIWDVAGIFPVGSTTGSSYGLVEYGRGNSYRFGVIANSEATGAVASGYGPDTGLGTALDFKSGAEGNITVAGYLSGYNTAAVTYESGSANNLSLIGYTAPYGSAKAFFDAGTNNAIWQGATIYTGSGLKVITIDGSADQFGGTLVTGTFASIGTGAYQGSLLLISTGSGGYNQVVLSGTPGTIIGLTGGGSSDNSLPAYHRHSARY